MPSKNIVDYRSSGKVDRNGNEIRIGDRVRCFDGKDFCEGRIVFKNCAFRISVDKDWCGQRVNGSAYLHYNHTLLFDEVTGTSRVEVI